MTYIVLTVYIVLLSYMYSRASISKKKFLIAVFVPLTVLMGIRSIDMPICVDAANYKAIFDFAKVCPIDTLLWGNFYFGVEKGYLIINKLFSYVSLEYYHFQIFVSIVFCMCTLVFLNRDVKVASMGVACFLGLNMYLAAYNISRQMMVVMLFALLMPLFHRRNKVYALAALFLFSTIHTTSLLLGIILIIDYLPKKIEKFLPILLVLFIVFFDEVILSSIPYFERYSNYFENEGDHTVSLGLSMVLYAFFMVISMFSYYFIRNNSHRDRINALLSTFAILCVFLGLKMNYMERIGMMFFPYTILTITNLKEKLSPQYQDVYSFFITAIMLFFFYLRSPDEFIHY